MSTPDRNLHLPAGITVGGRGLPDLSRSLQYGTFDIDGTLKVPPGEISPAVIAEIARFKETGALVGIASGRALWAGREEMSAIGVTGPSIFSRGATVANPDGGIRQVTPISLETLNPLIELLRINGIAVHLDTPHRYYGESDGPLLRHHESYFSVGATRVNRFEDILGTVDVVRVAITAPVEFADSDLLRSIPIHFPELGFGIAPSPRDPSILFVNITPHASSPDRTVETVAARLGIDCSRTISFGDGDTDIAILSRVGVAVAMGNASDTVKRHAHLIAPHVRQDGVAAVLNFVMSVQERWR